MQASFDFTQHLFFYEDFGNDEAVCYTFVVALASEA